QYIWKLDADFEPESDFHPENLMTINLPKPSVPVVVNLMGVPLTIAWEGNWLDGGMPTIRPALALRFVCVTDEQGRPISAGSGSWNQYGFRKGTFMLLEPGHITVSRSRLTTVTFAVVPNVHATFYAQPKLLNEPESK